MRLIGGDGDQLGIFTSQDAQRRAYDEDLDLVLLSPNAEPPVVRIMDYGKFKYEQLKKQKEARKNAKTINVKEIRLSPSIQQHDLETKAGHAIKFINNEDKVKVSIRFKGREVVYKNQGVEVMNKFYDLVKDIAEITSKPKMEGRNLVMFLEQKPE